MSVLLSWSLIGLALFVGAMIGVVVYAALIAASRADNEAGRGDKSPTFGPWCPGCSTCVGQALRACCRCGGVPHA